MLLIFFFFQAEDGIRDYKVTGVQTCALPISRSRRPPRRRGGPSSREPVVEAQVRPHPGGDRETRLLRPRQPDLRPEDVVVPEHDAAEELLVDEPHRLGGRERLAGPPRRGGTRPAGGAPPAPATQRPPPTGPPRPRA